MNIPSIAIFAALGVASLLGFLVGYCWEWFLTVRGRGPGHEIARRQSLSIRWGRTLIGVVAGSLIVFGMEEFSPLSPAVVSLTVAVLGIAIVIFDKRLEPHFDRQSLLDGVDLGLIASALVAAAAQIIREVIAHGNG